MGTERTLPSKRIGESTHNPIGPAYLQGKSFAIEWVLMKRLAGSYLIVFLAGFGCVRTPSGRAGKPSASAQVAEHSASRLRLYCRPTTKSRERTKSAVAERAVLAGSASDTVHGRVVVPNGNDAQELAVSIGEQRTLTDVDGRFVFHNIPATYDLKVADEDGRRVTAYYGLTRRDPVVAHTAHDASKYGSECYHASVAGRLQVDPGIPGSSIAPPKVYFFSPTGFAEVDSTQVPRQGLATYGPVPVDWTGDSVTSGTLLALSIGQANAYLATVPVAR